MRLFSSRTLLSALILGAAAHAQSDLSYQRLASAAKLWAYVKYFHPRVTAAPLEWDRAFAESAPKVLRARSEAEYSAAVAEMLATLHDPATRILQKLRDIWQGLESAFGKRNTRLALG